MVSGEVWAYTILSVLAISLISLVGVFTLGIGQKKLKRFLIYVISFSAGALLGDAFIHLIPEVVGEVGFTLAVSGYILLGFVGFFVLEKFIHWQHCHGHLEDDEHIHAFSYTVLLGDGLHNLIDGLIIGASYIISIPAGIATTFAVALHEIPQEFGDFGVLLHGGFSKNKALLLNFASGLLAVVGAVAALLLSGTVDNIELILVPIAAGGFIYIAATDLIPELHKHSDKLGKSFWQFVAFLVGIGVMVGLLFVG